MRDRTRRGAAALRGRSTASSRRHCSPPRRAPGRSIAPEGGDTTRFGLFFLLEKPEGGDDASVYDHTLEQIRVADELGYDYVWLAEHRFTRYGIAPDTLVLAAAAAAVTKRVRIGTAVIVLPFHDPVLLAEQVAMVDVISGGRFDFGTGRGYQAGEFRGLGVPMDESRTRYEEVMDICVGLWTQDHFSYQGQHYLVDDVTIEPKPVQKPHPPIWVTAMRTPATFEYAADRGYGIISGNPYRFDPQFREAYLVYRDTLTAIGKPELIKQFWALAPTFVHEDREQARELPRASADSYREAFAQYGTPRQTDGALPGGYERYGEGWDGARNSEYDQALDTLSYLNGDVAEVTDKLRQSAELGMEDFILWMNRGGAIPQHEVLKSMELFASKVMPQFQSTPATA